MSDPNDNVGFVDFQVALPKAILYERFSPRPDHAEEPDSIHVQHERNLAYCKLQGLDPVSVVTDEYVSARKTPLFHRNGGSQISDLLLSHRAKHVVAQKLDRVFRDTRDGLSTLEEWKTLGVSLHLADEGGCSLNTSTATGYFLTTILLASAALEPMRVSERTSGSMLYKQRQGQRIGGATKIPYGFELDPDSMWKPTKDGSRMLPSGIRPCVVEQDVIADIRRRYSIGGVWSFTSIANALNEEGTLSRGKEWTAEKVRRIIARAA